MNNCFMILFKQVQQFLIISDPLEKFTTPISPPLHISKILWNFGHDAFVDYEKPKTVYHNI